MGWYVGAGAGRGLVVGAVDEVRWLESEELFCVSGDDALRGAVGARAATVAARAPGAPGLRRA